jgi:hypothetical protein
MNTIFDSILLNSLQMENNSDEAVLGCTIFERGQRYETEVVLSGTALNQLLNELSYREIEVDFDNGMNEIRLPDGGSVYHMQFDTSDRQPVFLPLYVLPERIRLLRA